MSETELLHNHGDHKNLLTIRQYLDNTTDFQIIADVFKQLCDPTRIRIFWFLCHYEECVLDIASILNMSSPAVSHHLKSLRNSGLITSRREGKEVYYRATDTPQCMLLHEMIEEVMKISCPVSESTAFFDHRHSGTHSESCQSDHCSCGRSHENTADHIHDIHAAGHIHEGDHPDDHSDNSVAHEEDTNFSHVDDYHLKHCDCGCRHEEGMQHSQYQDDQLKIIHKIHYRLISDIEKRWTVEELSRLYLMNPTTLKTLFKSVYGNSIAAHIKEHRMEKAANLLTGTDISLADIASTIGYSSQSKFTAAFKDYYLMLPKDYRRINKRSKNMKAIVILAGGKSSRMGTDKVFLNYKGKTFLDNMLENAWKEFDRVIIAAGSREHAEKIYNHLKKAGTLCTNRQPDIIIDKYQEIGPMGGLLSVFEQTKLEHFAVCAVDLPNADMKALAVLNEELASCENDSVCAEMLVSSDGRIEPCAAAYSRKAYAILSEAEKQGKFGIINVLGEEHIQTVNIDFLKSASQTDLETAFTNINTKEDYSKLTGRH